MTGRIIPIHGDPHDRIIALLPWFISGRLDPAERAEVEAHLTCCPGCRAEERMERRLEAEVAALPLDVEHGWARMRARLTEAAGAPPPSAPRVGLGPRLAAVARRSDRGLRRSRAWLIGSVALQAAVMVIMLAVVWPGARPAAPIVATYHALSAAPAGTSANLLIMFRPETPERDLRAALVASQARLVDGPTAAGAYLAHVPGDRRAAALAALRGLPAVAMAQALDPGTP
jgi:hypothetical protein